MGSNSSYVWRSIWAAKDLVLNYSKLRVGDGSNIFVTKDPWLPYAILDFLTTHLGSAYDNLKVQNLMLPGEQRWNRDLIRDIFQLKG